MWAYQVTVHACRGSVRFKRGQVVEETKTRKGTVLSLVWTFWWIVWISDQCSKRTALLHCPLQCRVHFEIFFQRNIPRHVIRISLYSNIYNKKYHYYFYRKQQHIAIEISNINHTLLHYYITNIKQLAIASEQQWAAIGNNSCKTKWEIEGNDLAAGAVETGIQSSWAIWLLFPRSSGSDRISYPHSFCDCRKLVVSCMGQTSTEPSIFWLQLCGFLSRHSNQ